ncbi:DUF3152 domain-containing protein [Jiangella asiatica]|uniref:DUF3152 domain-containing protein n=1 Tax=Jiangella asiatica TaxID=2530372 RepID=A0A4R5DET5_9ACTN|nr:DUF3152 domain-containing protein [Jiangella asiatica]TDE09135.1 DUF3152 domain-containing protein [Jiangella asiatica]
MVPAARRAGRPARGRRRPPRSSGRRPWGLGGFALVGVALLAVGFAVVPGDRGAGDAVGAEPSLDAVETAAGPSREPTVTPSPSPSPTPTPQIPQTGPGTFAVTPGQSALAGTGGTRSTYTVEVEDGLPFDPIEVAAVVDATLADPRSWIADGVHAFQRVPSDGDLRILIATPGTTDELCAPLNTHGEVSCRNGDNVVINALRWGFAVPHYDGDLAGYRQYVINHEVGHALGEGHVACPGAGEVAPVMLQQTYSLDGCLPNSWPYP